MLDEQELEQFALLPDEIIDTNDLPMAAESPCLNDVGQDKKGEQSALVIKGACSNPSSTHLLHEMAIVKSQINFDEQEFRERFQKIQCTLSTRFKGISPQSPHLLSSSRGRR